MTGLRYLESRSPARADVDLRFQRYAALRDEFVVGFRYNTARAYASDLDHLLDWAVAEDLDVVYLTIEDIKRYVGYLKSRRYTPNTLIRKRTALRGFFALAVDKQVRAESPMSGWRWRGRR